MLPAFHEILESGIARADQHPTWCYRHVRRCRPSPADAASLQHRCFRRCIQEPSNLPVRTAYLEDQPTNPAMRTYPPPMTMTDPISPHLTTGAVRQLCRWSTRDRPSPNSASGDDHSHTLSSSHPAEKYVFHRSSLLPKPTCAFLNCKQGFQRIQCRRKHHQGQRSVSLGLSGTQS